MVLCISGWDWESPGLFKLFGENRYATKEVHIYFWIYWEQWLPERIKANNGAPGAVRISLHKLTNFSCWFTVRIVPVKCRGRSCWWKEMWYLRKQSPIPWMALTIKTERPGKPKESVLLSKWDAVFGSFQSFHRTRGFIPRYDKQPWQNFKVKQRMGVQSVSHKGGCMLLAGQSQTESWLPRIESRCVASPLYNNIAPALSGQRCKYQLFREVLSENVVVVVAGTRHAGPKLPPLWAMYSARFSPQSVLITWWSGAASWEGSRWSKSCSETGPKGGTWDISRCVLQSWTGLYFLFLISGCCWAHESPPTDKQIALHTFHNCFWIYPSSVLFCTKLLE